MNWKTCNQKLWILISCEYQRLLAMMVGVSVIRKDLKGCPCGLFEPLRDICLLSAVIQG